jgi:hypothetical protein
VPHFERVWLTVQLLSKQLDLVLHEFATCSCIYNLPELCSKQLDFVLHQFATCSYINNLPMPCCPKQLY